MVLDTQSILLPIAAGGLYVHRVVNLNNGCEARDSVWVQWDDPIQAVLSVEPIRCYGISDGLISVAQVVGGQAPYFYSIENQDFGVQSSFQDLSPGHYTLRIRDDFGCTWEDTVQLTAPEPLSVALTASDTALVLGQTLRLEAFPTPFGADLASITWAPDQFVYAPASLQQAIKPEIRTEFVVQITDHNGCVAEDRLWVSVYNQKVYVPNIILQGSDLNGGFTVFGGNGVLEIRSLRVFDRWGEQVFERFGFLPNDPGLGWDGSYRGELLNPGVFVWYAELLLQDGRIMPLKGDVTLVR